VAQAFQPVRFFSMVERASVPATNIILFCLFRGTGVSPVLFFFGAGLFVPALPFLLFTPIYLLQMIAVQ